MALWGKFASQRLYRQVRLAWPAVVALAAITTSLTYRHVLPLHVNPLAYTPLLDTIAKGESQGNYNAYFGNAANDQLRFTDMSVGEVLAWQEAHIREGNVSSAVGKYQIIRPTLQGLVRQLNVNPAARFDASLQDKMAVALLERRGAREYMAGNLTRSQFAASLAQEWAALPKASGTNPEQSYYAGDGINTAHISLQEVYTALAQIQQPQAKL